jgi:citrate lyase subunit beta/citryl-CoA lyase
MISNYLNSLIMENTATAGNKGTGIRSDCFVTLSISDSGGIHIELKSKVEMMYGNQIKSLAHDVLSHFDIINAALSIEDSGALPFVIAARIEAAIKCLMDTDKEFLLPELPKEKLITEKDRLRVCRLYVPGNSPALMINAGIYKPDGIILDLEDSVAPAKKQEARLLVRNALRYIDFYGAEMMVRINQLPQGLNDLKYIIPGNVNVILIPKCESAEEIIQVNKVIADLREETGSTSNIWLMPIIESALGVIRAYEIASAADNIVAMAIGLEDYTADIGAHRTTQGSESLFARSQMVNACRAAGIQPNDSVFSDFSDKEGLFLSARKSKEMGFDGMGCIHPGQINTIREGFSPDVEEIEKAIKIVEAFEKAQAEGLGVTSLGSKMIDPPVVKRAQKLLVFAKQMGKI